MVDSISGNGLSVLARQTSEHQGGERRVADSSCFRDHISLSDQGSRHAEVATPCDSHGLRGQVDRQLIKCADVTGELSLPGGNRVPAVLVPQDDSGGLG